MSSSSPTAAVEAEMENLALDAHPLLLDRKDIWIGHILPFLGMGHFAFVGATNKQMNSLYQEFCGSIKDPPKVKVYDPDSSESDRPATSKDTYYSAAFFNVPTAEYWKSDDTSNTDVHNNVAILFIAISAQP